MDLFIQAANRLTYFIMYKNNQFVLISNVLH